MWIESTLLMLLILVSRAPLGLPLPPIPSPPSTNMIWSQRATGSEILRNKGSTNLPIFYLCSSCFFSTMDLEEWRKMFGLSGQMSCGVPWYHLTSCEQELGSYTSLVSVCHLCLLLPTPVKIGSF